MGTEPTRAHDDFGVPYVNAQTVRAASSEYTISVLVPNALEKNVPLGVHLCFKSAPRAHLEDTMKYFFICMLALSGCASDPKYAITKPFLYEIRKDKKVGYMFGTIHLGVAVDDLPEAFWPYFKQADILLVEDSFEESNVEEFNLALAKQAIRSADQKPLKYLLSSEDYNKFSTILKTSPSYKAEFVDRLSPFGGYGFLYSMIGGEMVTVTHGEYVRLTGKFMLDKDFYKRGIRENKTMTFLDSKNTQAIASCIGGQDKHYLSLIHDLVSGKQLPKKDIESVTKMIELYRTGDSAALTDHEGQPYDACLLADRNEKWIPQIISAFDNYNQPFIAVGLSHLFLGNSSLKNLLERKGYRVKRVENPFAMVSK